MAIRLEVVAAHMDPCWFRSVRSGTHEVCVAAEGRVLLEGQALRFADSTQALPEGTRLRLWLNRWFECEPMADYEARLEVARAQQAEKDAARRTALNAQRDAALLRNGKLAIGVAWEPAIKDVLSGLTPTSWGDGRSRATVQHIRLLESMSTPRLNRRRGDFLCTAASGSNGKAWSNGGPSVFLDGEGQPYPAPVTCKKCVELAEKLAAARSARTSSATFHE